MCVCPGSNRRKDQPTTLQCRHSDNKTDRQTDRPTEWFNSLAPKRRRKSRDRKLHEIKIKRMDSQNPTESNRFRSTLGMKNLWDCGGNGGLFSFIFPITKKTPTLITGLLLTICSWSGARTNDVPFAPDSNDSSARPSVHSSLQTWTTERRERKVTIKSILGKSNVSLICGHF